MKLKNKTTAELDSKLMLEISTKLEDSRAHVYANCDEEEWQKYGEVTGEILGIIVIDVLNEIFTDFPELKPDEYYLPAKKGD